MTAPTLAPIAEREPNRDRSSGAPTQPSPSVFTVSGMDCGDCARSVEVAVAALPGVGEARVSFGAGTLTVVPDGRNLAVELPRAVAGAVARAGYRAELRSPGSNVASVRVSPWRERRVATTAVGGAFWALGWAVSPLASGAPGWLVPAVFLAAMVIAGAGFARAGWQSARVGRFDMNVLMSLSSIGAALLGEWSEGATVVVLFALGGTLQSLTLDRTRGAIRALMDLSPPEALLVDGATTRPVPVAALALGDLVRVKPGARVPADGRIVEGDSALDESAITGESLPRDKGAGHPVFAGTVNGHGALLVSVSRLAADSALARIVHQVEEAQGSRAPAQQLVDRFAAVYTPLVILGAVVLALIGVVATGDPAPWVYRALVLLVIACPCALVISTPVTIVAAIGAATRRGVLVKGGAALEAAGRVRVVAFDKTGTLTEGTPSVTGVVPLAERSDAEVFALAAAVERLSEHPLARAVTARAEADGVTVPTATAFRALPGKGARAVVGSRTVAVGNVRLIEEMGVAVDDRLAAILADLAVAGQTPLVVALGPADGEPRSGTGSTFRAIGVVAVADTPRPAAGEALAMLRRAGVARIVVLTGDTAAVGDAIGRAVGADEVHAELLPATKAATLADLRARYGPVAMVGDGVNDAPALATADVGMAMGAAGTDVALETADLALMGDDLRGIAHALCLSRRATRIIRQNITLSLAVKLLALSLGALGFVNLWIAVLADTGMSLLVTLNGLRVGLTAGTRDEG